MPVAQAPRGTERQGGSLHSLHRSGAMRMSPVSLRTRVLTGLLVGALSPSATTDAAAPWVPPVGIPAPSFGITQTAPPAPSPWTGPVAGFYYIDASSPAATDSGNPNGWPGKPRETLPNPIPEGAVVEM